MTDRELRKSAKAFSKAWQGRGNEKQDTQEFWNTLLRDVFEVSKPEEIIEFEHPVEFETTTKFIDALIPSKGVLIEQKGIDINLNVRERQSDGEMLSPFEQALRYEQKLGHGKDFDIKIRYIITCNFKTFQIYDLSDSIRQRTPIAVIELDNLENCFHQLDILVDKKADPSKELEISKNAGEIIGKIYNAFLDMLGDNITPEITRALNVFCVRLVFCFFAEDSGLFTKNAFKNYLSSFNSDNWQMAFKELFDILDQPADKRNPFLQDKLKTFPYVNGSLFSEDSPIPPITEDIANLIINGCNFDWREISPTIFGAVFESTLNPETRRAGGMHYTSIENIHKVVDPLFLDEFLDEFDTIMETTEISARNRKLRALQEKMASKKFFDPACGSGNFLTETYVSLRRLENRILKELRSEQVAMFATGKEQDDVKVSIQQFYGIEINDFAVSVAKTALWIAEIQMLEETAEIFASTQNALPLRTYNNIVEGNALQIDWETVVPKNELSYIMGNPPFIGMKEQTNDNKKDMALVVPLKKFKQLDYVACWYFKASSFIQNTDIKVAFVSSNSICQGEQALTIWEYLFNQNGIYINFAYTTFNWDSEASDKAHVHCVIVGFSTKQENDNKIYSYNLVNTCSNINQYLAPADNIFIKKSGKPICNVEPMTKGAQLIDGGNFVVGGDKEYQEIMSKEPDISPFIRRYFNAKDLLNNAPAKYVLYLEHCSPRIIKESKFISERVKAVYEYRANNESPSTNVLKDTPTRYFQPQVPNAESIVVPVVSSGNRKYIPVCFMPTGMVYTNALFYIDDASIYTFGVLTSNVHMAWVNTVCGRMKSDIRYSNTMAYNTFPWCNPTDEQKAKIEQTAQAILDARAKYPDCSLADLYDELTMPIELRKAHMANDRAVMEAYGFPVKSSFTEADCVAELMKMYQELTK